MTLIIFDPSLYPVMKGKGFTLTLNISKLHCLTYALGTGNFYKFFISYLLKDLVLSLHAFRALDAQRRRTSSRYFHNV